MNSQSLLASLTALLPFAASYMVLATLPGPNFMIVADASLSANRTTALLAAAGVATGAMVLAILMASGAASLSASLWVRTIAALIFCGFMFWIGLKAIRRALHRQARAKRASFATRRRYFLVGLATAATNPASAIFFGSALLRETTAAPAIMAAPLVVFVIAGSWFALVGLLLTLPPVQALHQKYWRSFDAASGVGLIGLGLAGLWSV